VELSLDEVKELARKVGFELSVSFSLSGHAPSIRIGKRS
jgi:hypothetical protein